jgi:predicted DNA-binding transcriptional regulator YafY
MLYERSLAIEHRLNALLRLIHMGRYSTATLATELCVSIPTVSRDIAALRQRGYAIRAMRGPDGWCYELTAEPTSTLNGERAQVPWRS